MWNKPDIFKTRREKRFESKWDLQSQQSGLVSPSVTTKIEKKKKLSKWKTSGLRMNDLKNNSIMFKEILKKILIGLSVLIISTVVFSAVLLTIVAMVEEYKLNPDEMKLRYILTGTLILFVGSIVVVIKALENRP